MLTVVDHQSDALDGIRSGLTYLVTPIFVIADYPSRSTEAVAGFFASRSSMSRDNETLRREQLLLKAQTQKMAVLAAENERLRDLLGSSRKLEDNVLVAEIIGVDADPDSQVVILDKGKKDDVFVGQPLLDAEGLMGQVIETGDSSRAMLITDVSHSVPIQVNRNNIRVIAVGTGKVDELELVYVPHTSDIRIGDLLVSSGLGGRFPAGYPVGTVTQVIHDTGKPFATVKAKPSALLDRSKHVLLVFTEERALQRIEEKR
ncbi:MAG: rod shape-determining protein MreC [Pseudomonadales bacterium]|nr:rod shape-determining protein MreC [Pseudomonadales bacterium]MDP7145005.1 rod shape-determining protein MreC [Pseudomonadales bacterium]MDP7357187.1 rod shape-determining protein MreC [Pseudomonadales bacterium]MDP7594750.1 rod shape-determining protein MreC [Pseudomonadales bacterium]